MEKIVVYNAIHKHMTRYHDLPKLHVGRDAGNGSNGVVAPKHNGTQEVHEIRIAPDEKEKIANEAVQDYKKERKAKKKQRKLEKEVAKLQARLALPGEIAEKARDRAKGLTKDTSDGTIFAVGPRRARNTQPLTPLGSELTRLLDASVLGGELTKRKSHRLFGWFRRGK